MRVECRFTVQKLSALKTFHDEFEIVSGCRLERSYLLTQMQGGAGKTVLAYVLISGAENLIRGVR